MNDLTKHLISSLVHTQSKRSAKDKLIRDDDEGLEILIVMVFAAILICCLVAF